jgi:hypothetical protein
VAYIVRRDLTALDLAIPSINTDEYYTDDDLVKMKYVGCVDEKTYEDDEYGAVVKFRDPRGHFVLFESIDLDWVEEA